ncbi:Uncharacterized protein ACO02O_07980 [Dirofilaria immitis]
MKLEPFKEVLKRQIPIEIGKPIPMIVYNIDHPKNCGDPWIGAYSKHGFCDSYKINYDSLKIWKTISSCNSRFIVAKNQSNELLGSIMITYLNNIAIIGLYYIIEEYRHSGIGSKLFNEVLKNVISNEIVIFHSASYLANKCYRFDFTKSFLQQQQQQQQWKFATYEISNPSGFPTLQNNNITTIKYNNLSNIEFYQLSKYDNNLTQLNRDIWLKEWFKREHFNTYIAFNENKVIGYGCSREVAGGYVLPLLVGPLYADNFEIANALLYAILKKYYNPENDYDWDPDIYAIYRRNVYFIIPEQNTQMIALMEKLKGEGGMIKKDRLHYITQTTDNLPNIDFNKIFAISDIHMSVI